MNDEFGVGAAAEFVKIHANALAIDVDAEGNNAVEKEEEQVYAGEDKAEQSCDADELGEKLARLRGEDADSEKTEQAAYGVNADGARRVVNGDSELKEFDEQGRGDAGEDADEQGLDGRDECGAGTGGNETGEPSVGAQAGVGFAKAEACDGEGSEERA